SDFQSMQEIRPLEFYVQQMQLEEQSQQQETDHPEYPSWESLPWPALDRIFSFLRTDEECYDLANLANVSTHFRAAVKKYMGTPSNRPGLESVYILKSSNGLDIGVTFFPINIPFYDLSKLDWGRFERVPIGLDHLRVMLKDSEDPAVEQVTVLLSTTIQ
ncbi:hypothetical protein PMAYCL1PPCAC_28047, partial [Pristionchus mayeri]